MKKTILVLTLMFLVALLPGIKAHASETTSVQFDDIAETTLIDGITYSMTNNVVTINGTGTGASPNTEFLSLTSSDLNEGTRYIARLNVIDGSIVRATVYDQRGVLRLRYNTFTEVDTYMFILNYTNDYHFTLLGEPAHLPAQFSNFQFEIEVISEFNPDQSNVTPLQFDDIAEGTIYSITSEMTNNVVKLNSDGAASPITLINQLNDKGLSRNKMYVIHYEYVSGSLIGLANTKDKYFQGIMHLLVGSNPGPATYIYLDSHNYMHDRYEIIYTSEELSERFNVAPNGSEGPKRFFDFEFKVNIFEYEHLESETSEPTPIEPDPTNPGEPTTPDPTPEEPDPTDPGDPNPPIGGGGTITPPPSNNKTKVIVVVALVVVVAGVFILGKKK